MSNNEVLEMDSSGNVTSPKPPNLGGRPFGSKTSPLKRKRFAEFVAKLLEDNENNIERWIHEVAEGKATQIIPPDPENGIAGGMIPGIDPDPAKALIIIAQLAEYAEPKQGRTLAPVDPEAPSSVPILNVTIGGKRIAVDQGSTTPRDE